MNAKKTKPQNPTAERLADVSLEDLISIIDEYESLVTTMETTMDRMSMDLVTKKLSINALCVAEDQLDN
jgi:hypothetical protein